MLKSLIAALTEAYGPSGYELPVREIVREHSAPFVDDIFDDQMGNLIAHKESRLSGSKRLMLNAYLDEIGLIISHIDENGFARFTPLGPWNLQSAVGCKVEFADGQIGVIGCEETIEDRKNLTVDRLYIDTGATSYQDCRLRIGDTAVFYSPYLELAKRIVGKALDNRVGVALLVELIGQMDKQKISSPHDLFFVFSSQGQLGSRGATAAAYRIEPDICLSIDLTTSGGTPKSAYSTIEMGKGPAIRIRDYRMFSDPTLVKWMRSTAEKENILYQIEIREKSESRFDRVQTSRSGIISVGLAVPARYLHSPSEMADLRDVESASRLLMALTAEPFSWGK